MATGSLYGSTSESTGLYGIGAASGGTYFEWFIFQDSATAPPTPTGGSWNFSNNTGTPPTGWVVSPPPAPVNQVWVSIVVVDSRNVTTLSWSVPGLMTGSGLPILSASGVPSAGTGMNGQLYINTATTPQSLYFKQSGAWTQLTGSTLYATAGANSNITSLTGLTGGISTPDFVQFDTGITPTTAVAKLQWDPTHGGLQVGMAGGSVNLQVGQEEVVYVFNNTGSQINEGQVVKITGSQGQRVTVALAQANNDGNSATILGMATENIANNASGFITTQGIVNNVNTNGFADGTVVYLSPTTPGGFTATKPVAPNHMVLVGYIVKGNSGGAGSVFIHPQNGYELSELHDVLITSVANNNLLRYNSAVPAWVNIAGPSGTIVGTSDTQTLTNKTLNGASNTFTNIPNSGLVNSNVTINGSSVSLGSSITISAPTANNLTAGTGLSGGPFNGTSPVTLSISNVGTAGTYGDSGTIPVITTNAQGQVTGVSLQSVIVDSSDISGTIAIAQGGTSASSALGARLNLLPNIATNNGKVLAVNAGASDVEWRTVTGTGTVSSVDVSGGTTGLTTSGGPITAAGVITLGGTLGIANGGTGQTTANAAFNALVPSQTGNTGKYLTTNGTSTSWADNGSGTVTSVSGTGTVNGLTLTGTVTSSGSLTLGGTLDLSSPPSIGNTTPNTGSFTTLTTSGTVTHNAGTANGVAYLNGSKVLTTGSALTFDGTTLGTNKLTTTGFATLGLGAVFTGASNNATGVGVEIGYSSGASSGYIQSFNRSTSAYAPIYYDGSLQAFNVSGTEQMRLTSTGLGIGTSSPLTKLDIKFAADKHALFLASSSYSNGADLVATNDTGSEIALGLGGNTVRFYTGATERARITSGGDLLVGTDTSAGYKFRVAGGQTQLYVVNAADRCLDAWNSAASGDNEFVNFFTDAGATKRGSISYNRAGGLTAYNITSDYRAKDIIGPVTDSGALIDATPVYMGKMKGATQERPMFIAHEVPAYAHTGEKDAVDADGNPVYQQMDATALVPVMWAEIQSLRQRLAAAGI